VIRHLHQTRNSYTLKNYILQTKYLNMMIVDFYSLQLSFRCILCRWIILGILKYQTVIIIIHPISSTVAAHLIKDPKNTIPLIFLHCSHLMQAHMSSQNPLQLI
jgi:hypothetical protein